MKHWSVDTMELQKSPGAFVAWELEQAVNFGIRDGKIKKSKLKKYWNNLNLDPHKKKFLELALAK